MKNLIAALCVLVVSGCATTQSCPEPFVLVKTSTPGKYVLECPANGYKKELNVGEVPCFERCFDELEDASDGE